MFPIPLLYSNSKFNKPYIFCFIEQQESKSANLSSRYGFMPFFFVSVLLDFYFFLFIIWDFMSKFCASSLTTLLYFVAALFSEDGES